MIKLILFTVAIFIFGTNFIGEILNQFHTAKVFINDLYQNSFWMIKIIGKFSILFNNSFMFTLSSIYIIYFIISKTLYNN